MVDTYAAGLWKEGDEVFPMAVYLNLSSGAYCAEEGVAWLDVLHYRVVEESFGHFVSWTERVQVAGRAFLGGGGIVGISGCVTVTHGRRLDMELLPLVFGVSGEYTCPYNGILEAERGWSP